MSQNFTLLDEISGFEFDWYAVDLSGQYALFSTAGSGMIPECIANFIDEYSDIKVPSASTNGEPWKPLSKAGFFVFDNLNSDNYQKKVDADGIIKPKTINSLEALPNLLQFNGQFDKITEISDLSHFQLKNNISKNKTMKFR